MIAANCRGERAAGEFLRLHRETNVEIDYVFDAFGWIERLKVPGPSLNIIRAGEHSDVDTGQCSSRHRSLGQAAQLVESHELGGGADTHDDEFE